MGGWIKCNGGTSGGGGTQWDTVLLRGQVSRIGAYMTAYFSDIIDAGYKYFYVQLEEEKNSITYYDYIGYNIKAIPASGEIAFKLWVDNVGVEMKMARTYIRTSNYSGSWLNQYATIRATKEELF